MNRILFLFIFVLFLAPGDDAWARGDAFAAGQLTLTPSYDYSHVSHSSGFRERVWNQSVSRRGMVRDPSKSIIRQGDPFDLGHKPGFERWRMAEHAQKNNWTPTQWNNAQKDPRIYRPEQPRTNRSGKYEMPRSKPTTRYLARKYDKLAKIPRSRIRLNSLKSFPVHTIKLSGRAHQAAQTAGIAARFIKPGTLIRIGGGVTAIVGGAFDMGYGVHKYYTAHQRYLSGELDWDIAAGKKVLAVGHVITGAGGVAAGILLIVPEPVFTKATAAALIIAGVVYIIVDYILDAYLERLQAKRTLQRQETLARITWQERQTVCIEQLRQAI